MPREPEEEMDLPPMDAGIEDEEALPEPEPEELETDDDEEGGLDDAVASDLDVGADLDDEADEGDGLELAAEGEIDVGALDDDIVDDEGADDGFGDERIEGIGGDDEDLDDDQSPPDDGSEGTTDPIEDDVDDADLPDLDADEQGDFDDGSEAEPLADFELPPWDRARWVPRDGAGAAVPSSAVTASGGRVAALGDVLLVVDDGAHAARKAALVLAGASRPALAAAGSGAAQGAATGGAVALLDELLVVATSRGALFVSGDFGATALPLPGFSPDPPISAPATLGLALTTGRAFFLCGGALWNLAIAQAGIGSAPRFGSSPPAQVRAAGTLAIAASAGAVLALAAGDGEAPPTLERLKSDDEGWVSHPLDGDARAAASAQGVRIAAAAGGRAVAIAAPTSALAVSRDGGTSFRTVALADVVDIVFAGEGEDAPLVALVAPDDAPVGYLVVVQADGTAVRVTEIAFDAAEGDEDDAGGPLAIAWDAAREVVWVASRLGLGAFGRPARH